MARRVLDEPAARELAAQVKALVTGAPAASFLAAHPVGSVFETTDPVSPAARFGGLWEPLPSLDGYRWARVDGGGAPDGTAEQFMQAHPVGSIYEAVAPESPSRFGGSWRRCDSARGGYLWERIS